MEDTRKMRLINRIVIIPAVVAACGMATGCFSYHKTVDATTPAPVVETAPPVVETTPAVVVPPATSSTTTTTTDSNGIVERQRTSTYTAPY
jgi:hypothetical protein